MEHENICINKTTTHNKSTNVINLPYRVYQSFKGKYFIGHTPFLNLGDHFNAWGGLVNPDDSGVNMYVNTFTVSNTSNTPFIAQQWLNSKPLGKVMVSPHISPANTIIDPLPDSNIALTFAEHLKDCPSSGVSLFSRIAEANSTVVGNYLGKIIVPPGGSFIVYLYAPAVHRIKVEVAFGWWEQKICSN